MVKLTIPEIELMSPGHTGCQGCGATIAMRYALKALGEKTIVSIPACCWAVMPGVWPNNCMRVPLLYTAFETTGASISGIKAALRALGEEDVTVMGWAGDGGTADIGMQALSAAAERNEDVIYVMYDNEAYMNTGIQRSGATPLGAWTTTTPVGKTKFWERRPKKPMVDIVAAHKVPYAATLSIGYPEDFVKKMKKAKEISGFRFLHIYSPCPTGWKSPPQYTPKLAKLAVTSRAFPLYEVEEGIYRVTMKPKKTPLKEYLMLQGRFRHLTDEDMKELERDIERRWKELLLKEEMTAKLEELNE
ncbi:2-ketoisovalerate ferredoxin oxidoreductase [Thermoplasmatales archaeon ex4484_36]|nr:MAG: 2-ketoisovalerate ferredoxin oxidoreductase [Thermoplasmatales archaeon ex4484_36]RLF56107.1 MAG: pyruvate synthase subunit beta [Thermoplasmata archaeon]RLF76694.1 MAG: pyruvate synthase subunit beta [Thermoplasmata archaeon]